MSVTTDKNKKQSLGKRLKQCVVKPMPAAFKTIKWLLKITIPVSLLVFVLNYTGVLGYVSNFVAPFFELMGLPGESAFVLLTSVFTNIYSVIAVITTLGMETRDATILAVMCLISHGFIIETAVLKKTGSSAVRMLLVRILSSLVAGYVLNLIMPSMAGFVSGSSSIVKDVTFLGQFTEWGIDIALLSVKITVLVVLLMILQQILVEFGITKILAKVLRPFLIIMGLPEGVSFSWIVANTLGLAYGSAVMIDQVENGHMTKYDADKLNHHIAVSHSQLEDPLLFVAIGLPFWWLVIPRVVLAIIVVWIRNIETLMYRRLYNEKNNS